MMNNKRVLRIATRGRRFAAGMIDFLPTWILVFALFRVVADTVEQRILSSLYGGFGTSNPYDSYAYRVEHWNIGPAAVGILLLVFIGVQLFFFSRSQTIGKAILGLQVVDKNTGRPIGFAKMLLREIIVKRASASIVYLGYIWILIDKYNRGWHDKILDTYVIDTRDIYHSNTSDNGYDNTPSEGNAGWSSNPQSQSANTNWNPNAQSQGANANWNPEPQQQDANVNWSPNPQSQSANTNWNPEAQSQGANANWNPEPQQQDANANWSPNAQSQGADAGCSPEPQSQNTDAYIPVSELTDAVPAGNTRSVNDARAQVWENLRRTAPDEKSPDPSSFENGEIID